ncbi:uncharacterized protein KY384_008720 [Bacidia gigantensis]|uniref:uncharacterized protein n=1 Tax=Bacidia gigantensis TaxID=2732470 RepID=UPI001D05002F|nr:uncharacterized protein KY384_008720 [Bacidia gigantensis]KAG8526520.1 hypothetical protein KY384_008720 [Bacidia gigantensis]
MSAVDQVFSISELLTSILEKVYSSEKILPLERVCKQWQAAIRSSPILRRRLFFDVQPSDDTYAGSIEWHPCFQNGDLDQSAGFFSWCSKSLKVHGLKFMKAAGGRAKEMFLTNPALPQVKVTDNLLSPEHPGSQYEATQLAGVKFEDIFRLPLDDIPSGQCVHICIFGHLPNDEFDLISRHSVAEGMKSLFWVRKSDSD